MKKFRLMLDSEVEIKWLNEMSEEGWKLTGFFAGFYTFEPCEKGKYVYQEDTTPTLFKVSDDYKEFMNETGIEIVQAWGPWVILCQEKSKGEFELFSDYESKIAHQKKILKIFKVVTVLELVCFVVEVLGAANGSRLAVYFAILIGLFLFAFCRMVFKTNIRINKLRAENGEIAVNENGSEIDPETGVAKRMYSPILAAGNGLYLIALCTSHEGSPLLENVHTVFLILSCILMVAGVYLTWSGTKN